MKSLVSILELETYSDNRGELHIAHLPFHAKRFYVMSGMGYDVIRCLHSHKKLVQFMYCAQGSFLLMVKNPYQEEVIELSTVRNVGVLIPNGLWRKCWNFSEDCIVVVMASEDYDPNDYIFDYDEYVEWFKQNLAKKDT